MIRARIPRLYPCGVSFARINMLEEENEIDRLGGDSNKFKA